MKLMPDRTIILPKFIYDKERKLAGQTHILLVKGCGLAPIFKTDNPSSMAVPSTGMDVQ